MTAAPDPSRGDEYHHPDGTVEILFAIEGDQFLTVREYSRSSFREAVQEASYQGINEAVAGLPPAEIYRSQGSPGPLSTEQNDQSE